MLRFFTLFNWCAPWVAESVSQQGRGSQESGTEVGDEVYTEDFTNTATQDLPQGPQQRGGARRRSTATGVWGDSTMRVCCYQVRRPMCQSRLADMGVIWGITAYELMHPWFCVSRDNEHRNMITQW
jgi:hypothetical protein